MEEDVFSMGEPIGWARSTGREDVSPTANRDTAGKLGGLEWLAPRRAAGERGGFMKATDDVQATVIPQDQAGNWRGGK